MNMGFYKYTLKYILHSSEFVEILLVRLTRTKIINMHLVDFVNISTTANLRQMASCDSSEEQIRSLGSAS